MVEPAPGGCRLSSIEDAVVVALRPLLDEQLRKSAPTWDPPRLVLTEDQRAELVRRVTAQFKALGEQEGDP